MIVAAAAIAILLVGLSSFGSVSVMQRTELANLWFGWPLPYLWQDQAFWVNPAVYPYDARFGAPYSYPWAFHWLPWLSDVAIVFLGVLGGLTGLTALARRSRSRVRPVRP